MRLLDAGRPREALEVAELLLKSEHEADHASGFHAAGYIHEDGGQGLPVDLDRALANYRQVALISPDSVVYKNMARVCLKQSQWEACLKYLELASSYELTPEVLLGFAEFNEKCPEGSAQDAMRYYAEAAKKWRFAGFFGYSRVARSQGRWLAALAVDICRLMLGPLFFVLIGSRATYRF